MVWQLLLNILFPKECLICGREGAYWCDDCQDNVVYLTTDTCLLCNEIASDAGVCADCFLWSQLDEIRAAATYSGTVLETIIHEMKFNYVEELAKTLANLLPLKNDAISDRQAALLVPLPLHRKRFLERGFNQSSLMADRLAERLGVPVLAEALVRVKHTDQQARLARRERFENMREAFACPKPKQLEGKDVYLIDDVLTSGATLSAAAKALKQAGTRRVIGVVVAHG